jgi:hypothetical protein
MKGKPNFLVADLETDPFGQREKPQAFLSGVCDGKQTIQWWGASCVEALVEYFQTLPRDSYVFFHNGGRFDVYFLPWPPQAPKIIDGRIVSCRVGKVTVRDSYALMPFKLADYRKTEIDYDKLTRSRREAHRAEIMQYHRDDLTATYELVAAFIQRYGLRLTAASTAIRELTKIHPVARKGESHDAKFRPFYFGGRVQCFEVGALKGPWRAYDVNSMYPFVMSKYQHPIGAEYEFTTDLDRLVNDPRPGFAEIDAFAHGCFPLKDENGRLDFPIRAATYRVTLFELRQAIKLNAIEVRDVRAGYVSTENASFQDFVQLYGREKLDAKARGDRIGELFAKLILNSSYGKFGANPENYYDWRFELEDAPFPQGWDIHEDWGWMLVLRRPSLFRDHSYHDVATAASITGAARAELMGAIAQAQRPIYCDTDSLICHRLDAAIGPQLGQWKIEAEADRAYIIARKTYALVKNNALVKNASKGVNLQLRDYFDLARGKDYVHHRDRPTFQKNGGAIFITRKVKGVSP